MTQLVNTKWVLKAVKFWLNTREIFKYSKRNIKDVKTYQKIINRYNN